MSEVAMGLASPQAFQLADGIDANGYAVVEKFVPLTMSTRMPVAASNGGCGHIKQALA
ncbi:MAG: hypothetical protein FWD08_03020 [Alphaproteobacteria bacterium]|nr:hypothetical protein [Alphaproteobacteria bacterium]